MAPSWMIHVADAPPLPHCHTRDRQISPSTTPQQIESTQLHARASISTDPNQTWHDHLKLITVNVHGLFKSKEDVHDLITHHDPDIHSLTETKITGGIKTPQWLDHLIRDYAWWHSSHHYSGTILCVIKNTAVTSQATQVIFQGNVEGRIVAAKLTTSSKPILLISTYWPSGEKVQPWKQGNTWRRPSEAFSIPATASPFYWVA
eukprot:1161444-Pelagomonas_calceolata.AAC.2